MDSILDFGMRASQWLQATYPQWEGFFDLITQLGREEFYLAILPLIYWSLDKKLGRHIAFVFLFSNSLNALLKHSFRGPRPFWLDNSLGLSYEDSYGVPSGHTQMAATMYLFLASWLKRPGLWLLAIVMSILMGVSRVYLGVHFVHDVIIGALLALLVLLGYVLWQQYFAPRFTKRILGQKLLMAISASFAVALVYIAVRLIIGAPDLSVAWADFVPDAELAGVEGMATAVGALLGMSIGINLEYGRVRFLAGGPVWKRIVRYLFGMLVTLALWMGLRLVFPSDPLWLAIPLRILRYFLTLLWVGYYAPMAFVKLGLADAEPDPGISLKL